MNGTRRGVHPSTGELEAAAGTSWDLDPLSAPGGPIDGVEHALILEAVLEGGTGRLAVGDAPHEVVDGVSEGVLVADDVPGGPPRCEVGMAGVRDGNVREATERARVQAELEVVHSLKVPHEAALGAVDFEAVVVLAARSEARPLVVADGTIREFHERLRRVVDVD